MKRTFLWLTVPIILLSYSLAQAQVMGFSVQSDGDDQLYQIDLNTGVASPIGATGFNDIESLTFGNGTLYGVDHITDQLVTCDITTGACTAVGPLGVNITGTGLTFDCGGNLLMSTDFPGTLYSIDPTSGAATAVGAQGQAVTGLAARDGDGVCPSGVFGLSGNNTNNLGCIDGTTGAFTAIGPLNTVTVDDGGIDFDGNGTLWGINDNNPSQIFTIDPNTGAATVVATVVDGASMPLTGFEALAIIAAICSGGGGAGCSVAGSAIPVGTAATSALVLLLPAFAVGFRMMRRSRKGNK